MLREITIRIEYESNIMIDIPDGVDAKECIAEEGARISYLAPSEIKTADYGRITTGLYGWDKSFVEILDEDGEFIDSIIF